MMSTRNSIAVIIVALLLCASCSAPAAAEGKGEGPVYDAYPVNNFTVGYVSDSHELVLASSEKYILPDLWSMYERTEIVEETGGSIEYYYVMLKRSSDFSSDTFRW